MKETTNKPFDKAQPAMDSAFDEPAQCRAMTPPPFQFAGADDDKSGTEDEKVEKMIDSTFIAELIAAMKEDDSKEAKESTSTETETKEENANEDPGLEALDLKFVLSQLEDPEFQQLMEEHPEELDAIFEMPAAEKEETEEEIEGESELEEENDQAIQQKPAAHNVAPVQMASRSKKKRKRSKTHDYTSEITSLRVKLKRDYQKVSYGKVHKKYGSAIDMHAILGPKAPMLGTGTSPKVKPHWHRSIRHKKVRSFFSRKMVQAHLLNDNLGGPGTIMNNLAPFTKSANSYHEKMVEKHMKNAVKNGHYIEYFVKIDYSFHPSARDIGGKSFYKSLNLKEKKELKRVCKLMPGKMICESIVLDKKGKPIKGKSLTTEIYNEDSSIK